MEHENMWRQENTRTCKDEITRERVGAREQENMWRQRNQEKCGDMGHKNVWRQENVKICG